MIYTKSVFLLFFFLIEVAGQQMPLRSSESYSPAGAAFTLQVPGQALPPQGFVFDPKGSAEVYGLIEAGSDFKVFNFEIKREGKRSFLTSVLQIRRKRHGLPNLINDSQVNILHTIIGDDVKKFSKTVQSTDKDGTTSQWFYRRTEPINNTIDAHGIVHVRTTRDYMVIIIVDCDNAQPSDPEIKAMLDSLKIKV